MSDFLAEVHILKVNANRKIKVPLFISLTFDAVCGNLLLIFLLGKIEGGKYFAMYVLRPNFPEIVDNLLNAKLCKYSS